MPLTMIELDAILFERQAVATKVATILVRACGTPDAAEAVLETLIEEDNTEDDRSFWDEVVTALAQQRG